MPLLWSDILTLAVCAEQSKQQTAQTDKAAPPAKNRQPTRPAATRSTPRSVDAKALDWEIKDISVHRSCCTRIRRLSKKNTHAQRGLETGWERQHRFPGVLILICMQAPNWSVPNSSVCSFLFCPLDWFFCVFRKGRARVLTGNTRGLYCCPGNHVTWEIQSHNMSVVKVKKHFFKS